MEFRRESRRLIVTFGRTDAAAATVALVGVAAGLAVFFGVRGSSASGTNPPPPAADVWAATPVFTIETDGHPCAHRQGRFWDYRALLHELPLDLSTGRLASAAVQSAIDTTRFRACVEERATREVVALDLLAAWEAGVFGTPTFFVNGRRFGGERTLDQLNELVRLALASGSKGR